MEISGFGTVLLFILGGLFFIIVALFMGKLLRPNHPNEEKMTTYESGEEPVNNAWGAFNVRFYVIALIFILFEVELVFLFPWAIVFADADLGLAGDDVPNGNGWAIGKDRVAGAEGGLLGGGGTLCAFAS